MKLLYKDLVIVGFNAEVEAECGYAVAIARHKSTDLYYRLSFTDAELALLRPDSDLLEEHAHQEASSHEEYPLKGRGTGLKESDLEQIRNEHRLTLFNKGVEFSAFHNVMVVHVAQPLLEAADLQLSSSPLMKDYDWKLLSESPYKRWVTCATADSVFHLMNYWGKTLEEKCIARLIDYFKTDKKERGHLAAAYQCADLALCAARKQMLRSDLYLLYILTISLSATPQRAANVFQLSVKPRYPEWEWPVFNEQLTCLVDALRLRARAERPLSEDPPFDPNVQREFPLVSEIVSPVLAQPVETAEPISLEALIKIVVSEATEVARIRNVEAKIAKAVAIAEEHRRLEPLDPAVENEIIEIIKGLQGTDDIIIDDVAKLQVFAADPILYLSDNATRLKYGSLSVSNLGQAVADYYSSDIGKRMINPSKLVSFYLSDQPYLKSLAGVG